MWFLINIKARKSFVVTANSSTACIIIRSAFQYIIQSWREWEKKWRVGKRCGLKRKLLWQTHSRENSFSYLWVSGFKNIQFFRQTAKIFQFLYDRCSVRSCRKMQGLNKIQFNDPCNDFFFHSFEKELVNCRWRKYATQDDIGGLHAAAFSVSKH